MSAEALTNSPGRWKNFGGDQAAGLIEKGRAEGMPLDEVEWNGGRIGEMMQGKWLSGENKITVLILLRNE